MSGEAGAVAPHYVAEPGAAGLSIAGLRAWPVRDKRGSIRPLIALATDPALPPRPMLEAAMEFDSPRALMPRDAGPGIDPAGASAWCIVCPAPPGPALDTSKPWPEAALIRYVLLPAAALLVEFAARGWTHRSIRPDNIFRAEAGGPVVLGPCWATPSALLQPAIYQPLESAICLPNARGDGTLADDVYALGVTLLVLALGRVPMAGLDDVAVLRRKLDRGSYAALTDGAALPPTLSDLLQGMLDDDPSHRPSPALLLDPRELRGRRIVRSPRPIAAQPLSIEGHPISGHGELAWMLGTYYDRAADLLASGTVQRWLRRSLADPHRAAALEEAARGGAGDSPADRPALTVMRAVARLEPGLPLAWRGLWLWPDGLGPALAACVHGKLGRETAALLTEIVEKDIAAAWSAAAPRRPAAQRAAAADPGGMLRDFKRTLWRASPGGGFRLLAYETNPFLACASPLLAGRPVVRLTELAPALEAAASSADTSRPPLDADILAFIVARGDLAIRAAATGIESIPAALEDGALLGFFAKLQAETSAPPLPGLARWLLAAGCAALSRVRARPTRDRLRGELDALAAAGRFAPMAALLADDAWRRQDAEGARQATARIRAIETRLQQIAAGAAERQASAHRAAYDTVQALGALGCVIAALALVLT